ncbi:MAG: PilN domain-containing protein [Phycisphaerae bacterium]|nr:PilN domain-containing protein [Phycisphaerae bacterium]
MANVDFLPKRVLLQRARRARLVRQGFLLCVCLVALTGLAFVRQGRVRQARAEKEIWTERSENVRQQVALRRDLEREQAELALKKKIHEQLGTRIGARDLLAELSRLLPPTMSLTALEFEQIDAQRETRRHAGRTPRNGGDGEALRASLRLVIRGLAPNDVDVANFIGRLSACPLFTEVQMGYTRTVEFRNREAREFEASFSVLTQ